jgi:hypothetical protein
MLRQWCLIVTIAALPTGAIAQVQSGVKGGLRSGAPLSGLQSGVRGGVRSGYDYRYDYNYQPQYRPAYGNCWRTTVVRGTRIIWNCQPYPPPSP